VHIVQEVKWSTEPFWTFVEKKHSLLTNGVQTLNRTADRESKPSQVVLSIVINRQLVPLNFFEMLFIDRIGLT